jgi:hypothetical protein
MLLAAPPLVRVAEGPPLSPAASLLLNRCTVLPLWREADLSGRNLATSVTVAEDHPRRCEREGADEDEGGGGTPGRDTAWARRCPAWRCITRTAGCIRVYGGLRRQVGARCPRGADQAGVAAPGEK